MIYKEHLSYGVRLMALGLMFCLAVLLALGGAVSAQDTPTDKAAGTQYKIGVVDLKTVVADYNKRKEAYDNLQKEVDDLQKDIDAMSQKIEKAKKDYEASRESMGDTERLDAKGKIEADYATYRSELDKRQRLIDSKEERVLAEVMKDIDSAITKIAEEENYHLILNNARSGPEPSILYRSPTIDITSKLLAKLNQQ